MKVSTVVKASRAMLSLGDLYNAKLEENMEMSAMSPCAAGIDFSTSRCSESGSRITAMTHFEGP